MKRIKDTMKTIVALMSLALICMLGTNADAASYKPGTTYVNPQVSSYKSRDEYYSVKKIRMATYDDTTFTVIYPKDATLEVKSPKKAMKASITYQRNSSIYGPKDSERIYVAESAVTVTEYKYYYKDYTKGTSEPLTLDAATGLYYYTDEETVETRHYNAEYDYWYTKYETKETKVYVTPNYTMPVKATYTDTATNTVYTYDRYDAVDGAEMYYNSTKKAFYYYKSYDKEIVYDNYQYDSDDYSTDKYEYARATVSLTSTKAGTYKVNVFVNGKKTTMTVYVTSDYDKDSYKPYKKLTLDGKTVYSNTIKKTAKNDSKTTVDNHNVKKGLKTAKFKATACKGMKITGIVSTYLNADGKAIYKKGKNGSKITLSQAYEWDNSSSNGSYSRSTTKNTYVFVSWKDTKLKTFCTYSVVKKNGVKMIKCVEKKTDGKKYTSYIEYDTIGNGAESPCTLWSY